MAKASNNDELNDAIKRGESIIEIEGDLARKIIRLKATGKVAWAIAFGAIGIAALMVIALVPVTVATGGSAAPVEGTAIAAAFAPAIAMVGYEVTVLAVGLAVAAGGVGVLTRLRSDYKIIEQTPNHVVLSKL